jgi:iron complex transport system permease protein
MEIRLPRLLLGLVVGASLAVSGAVMQGLFRNPLADPGLVGVSAGAGLGAIVAIVLGGLLPAALADRIGFGLVPLAAFAGGWASTMILYASRRGRGAPRSPRCCWRASRSARSRARSRACSSTWPTTGSCAT